MRTFQSNKKLAYPQSSNRNRIRSVQSTVLRDENKMRDQFLLLRKLEKGLAKQYDKEEVLYSDSSIPVPTETQFVKIEDKLWKYFMNRMKTVSHKVQKQRLNYCEKQLYAIKQQIAKKINNHKYQIEQLEKSIRMKNKQINEYFEAIKSQKIAQQTLNAAIKARRRRLQVAENDHFEKIVKIKQSIEQIREQVAKQEKEIKDHKYGLQKIEQEWKSFLRHFLKEGYYLQNGITDIFKQFIQVNLSPQKQDFPDFLDDTSKKYLINQYIQLRTKMQNPSNNNQLVKTSLLTQPKMTMRSLIQPESLQKIYDGTRGYMMQWLRNECWKDEVNLPRINSTKETIKNEQHDWRSQQRKRLRFIEDKQRCRKVKAVLFGSKVQTIG